MTHKVMLVCGDRNWGKFYLPDGTPDRDKMAAVRRGTYRILDQIVREHKVDTLIEGCADGGDRMAEDWRYDQGTLGYWLSLAHLHFPAEWDRYRPPPGRKNPAGPIRNIQMLEEGKRGLVVALHDNLAESKGTKHMVSLADKAGIPVLGFFSSDALRLDRADR